MKDGYEDGTFCPDEPVTRHEFAQMMYYNYAACEGYDLIAAGDLTSPMGVRCIPAPKPP